MAKRDPRVDPQVGDVLIYGPQWQRERITVSSVEDGIVWYRSGNKLGFFTLDQWWEWMRDAEVVTMGGSDAPR